MGISTLVRGTLLFGLALLWCAPSDAASNLRLLQGAYDTDAVAYFNALSGNSCAAPSVAFKQAVSAFVKAERTAGNWDSQDAEYILATTDSCTASINLAQPALYKITWNNSPSFTVQNGLNGNGTNQYGDIGANQSALLRMSQNNARFGVWLNSINTAGNFGLLSLGTKLRFTATTNKVSILNSASAITDNGGGTAGLHFAWRTNSTNVTTGLNGVIQSNAAANTSATMGAVDVTLCDANGTFCPAGVNELFVSFGAPLTSESSHYTNVRALLLALGVTGI